MPQTSPCIMTLTFMIDIRTHVRCTPSYIPPDMPQLSTCIMMCDSSIFMMCMFMFSCEAQQQAGGMLLDVTFTLNTPHMHDTQGMYTCTAVYGMIMHDGYGIYLNIHSCIHSCIDGSARTNV
jgi:hypothetical protein